MKVSHYHHHVSYVIPTVDGILQNLQDPTGRKGDLRPQTASKLKGALETAFSIKSPDKQSATLHKMVWQIVGLTFGSFSSWTILLSQDITKRILRREDKSQASAQIGLRVFIASGGYYTAKDFIDFTQRIKDGGGDVTNSLLPVVKEMFECHEVALGLQIAEIIECSLEKINTLAHYARKEAYEGRLQNAALLESHLRSIQAPSETISAALTSALASITAVIDVAKGDFLEYQKIYKRLASSMPPVPMVCVYEAKTLSDFVALAQSAIKLKLFDKAVEIGKTIWEKSIGDESERDGAIVKIAIELLGAGHRECSTDLLKLFHHEISVDLFMQPVSIPCEYPRELGMLAQQFLKQPHLDWAFHRIVHNLVHRYHSDCSSSKFDDAIWAVEQIDPSHAPLRGRLLLFIIKRLALNNNFERAIDLLKKLHKKYKIPTEFIIRALIKILSALATSKTKPWTTNWDRVTSQLENVILHESYLGISPEARQSTLQKAHKALAREISKKQEFEKASKLIKDKQITDEDDLCDLFSKMSVDQTKAAIEFDREEESRC